MAGKNEGKQDTGAKEMVRKITNKALFGGAPKLGDKKELVLGTVMGITRGIKTGESGNGPWTALTGAFEAHTHDGRILQSPVLFLPDPMNSMIAEQIANPDTESLQFAVRVKMVASDVPIGYEYRCETLVETDAADPLADLRSKALPSS